MKSLKKIVLATTIIIFTSCGSYHSIESFYTAHKNDNQVTAIRVPQFMLSLLSGISPEAETLLGNTKDLRYMQFPSTTTAKTEYLNTQMNAITGTNFIEIFRKNDQLKRNVISVREKKNSVKEILIYTNNTHQGSFLYFRGDFDPVKVREMAQNSKFDELTNGVLQQYNLKNSAVFEN
jgi:hypothetical protein